MIIFSDYIDLFQSLLMFLISRDQIVVVWMVSSCVAPGRGVCGGGGGGGGGVELGPWNIEEWKSYFPKWEGLLLYFTIFNRFCWFLSKNLSVFQLQNLIRCFLTDIEVCYLSLDVLAPWDIIKRKSHFSIFG